MSQSSPLVQGVPQWQPDEEVHSCSICHSSFSLFHRKHHCRKCGRVVCGDCSSHFTKYLAATYVVCPPSQIFLESPHVPHRTCDSCYEELEMLRNALSDGSIHSGDAAQENNNIKDDSRVRTIRLGESSSSLTSSVPIPGSAASDDGLCPLCARDLTGLTEEAQERHINECLANSEFSGSPDATRKAMTNRMLVYTVPQRDFAVGSAGTIEGTSVDTIRENGDMSEKRETEGDECVICLEDICPGQTVGRLECLCVFHYKCIMNWFERKGPNECPVHAVTT